MNERERLIELMKNAKTYATNTMAYSDIDEAIDTSYDDLKADYLLENGVVVLPPVDEKPISLEDFSIRTYNCLMRAGVDTIGKLSRLTCDDLSKIRNLGIKSIAEIIDKLRQYGYNIGFDAYGRGVKQK